MKTKKNKLEKLKKLIYNIKILYLIKFRKEIKRNKFKIE